MIRRLILIPVWMFGSAVTISLVLTSLIEWLISPGLGSTDTAEIAAALGAATLTLVAVVYVGVLGFRGRLPGTWRRYDPEEPTEEGSKIMRKALAAIGITLVAAAVAAIVSATVTVAYVPEVYQHQARSGDVDWIITVESEALRETRDLRVQLPDGYDTDLDLRYPLLLVLDGGWRLDHSYWATLALEWLELGEPMIVVGVINGVAGRGVDFVPPEHAESGRADRFLEFIETEALPAIDRELRTDSTRLIAGHSLGGLFVTYTLVQRPDLFCGRLALSPSLRRRGYAMAAELEAFLADSPDLDSYFYASVGSLESETMLNSYNALVAALEGGAPEGLRWEAEVHDGEDHDTNPHPSTPRGLRGFWEYWREAR